MASPQSLELGGSINIPVWRFKSCAVVSLFPSDNLSRRELSINPVVTLKRLLNLPDEAIVRTTLYYLVSTKLKDIQEFYELTLLDETKSIQQKTAETIRIANKWEASDGPITPTYGNNDPEAGLFCSVVEWEITLEHVIRYVTEGYHEKPSGRDLNARPPNYEAGELSARLPRSLSVYDLGYFMEVRRITCGIKETKLTNLQSLTHFLPKDCPLMEPQQRYTPLDRTKRIKSSANQKESLYNGLENDKAHIRLVLSQRLVLSVCIIGEVEALRRADPSSKESYRMSIDRANEKLGPAVLRDLKNGSFPVFPTFYANAEVSSLSEPQPGSSRLFQFTVHTRGSLHELCSRIQRGNPRESCFNPRFKPGTSSERETHYTEMAGHDGRIPGSLLPLTQALMTLQDHRSASPNEIQLAYPQCFKMAANVYDTCLKSSGMQDTNKEHCERNSFVNRELPVSVFLNRCAAYTGVSTPDYSVELAVLTRNCFKLEATRILLNTGSTFAPRACVQLASGRLIAKGSESASTYQIRSVPDQPTRARRSFACSKKLVEVCSCYAKTPVEARWTTGVRSPTGAEDFSSSLCVQTGSGAHPASSTMGTGILSREQSRPGRDADHIPPSSAEVKEERSYTSTHPKRLHGV
ncbi:Disks large 1 tumor suppressor protein [Zootermopsis nevadensis]|uniref:Disks large 1 tumor suppressor protein n=1 Tax=Zootermopsis nevadensis TaxID=136037 RepID=A0A067RCY8_ZOONE|nr:Disks large 1 tumor suppressor protein [Zootermopsis nevadensis]